jgi:hypothetical protein
MLVNPPMSLSGDRQPFFFVQEAFAGSAQAVVDFCGVGRWVSAGAHSRNLNDGQAAINLPHQLLVVRAVPDQPDFAKWVIVQKIYPRLRVST